MTDDAVIVMTIVAAFAINGTLRDSVNDGLQLIELRVDNLWCEF